MVLGDIIKRYRMDNKLSMDEFAKKSGLSKGYISMLEKNENPSSKKPIIPSLDTIRQIAQAMNMSVDFLIAQLEPNQKILIPQYDTELAKDSTTPSRTTQKKFSLSDDAIEVAQAYENASLKDKNSVRFILDLPTLEIPVTPYVQTDEKAKMA